MGRHVFHRSVFITLIACLLSSSVAAQELLFAGTVNNGKENLEAATVSLGNQTNLTSINGEFSFRVRPGTYRLIVTHVGYQKLEKEVTVYENNNIVHVYLTLLRRESLDTLVFLGSRSISQRTLMNSPVPVDAFSAKELLQTGYPGINQMLNFSAPSFNASRQLVMETITLRGLYPDHVLILINGNRYHTMAWFNPGNPKGQLGRGSIGNDLNTIPFSAIEKIEILRDGASAQYGSDAIAGVIDIRLKESTGKMLVNLHGGRYYQGDGANISVGMNSGISMKKKGFLNVSADFRFRDFTNRSGLYEGKVYTNNPVLDSQLIKSSGFDRKEPANNGDARYTGFGALLNGSYNVSQQTKIFWTGKVHVHENVFQLAYRFPKDTNQVNTALFPDGFKARSFPKIWDYSVMGGIKGEFANNWHWNLSTLYGGNTIEYNLKNSNNASQYIDGKHAQTEFYCGGYKSSQYSANLNLNRSFTEIKRIKVLNVAIGSEWRHENYQIRSGEKASYFNYAPTSGRQGGSQGLQGVYSDNAVTKSRGVAALYTDVEIEINSRLLFDLAGRYEYYNDFGGNLAGKLSARYKVFDKLSLRGSIGNGYHAPHLQQRYFSTVQSRFSGNSQVRFGVFNNKSAEASAFGVPSLTAEKSLQASAGLNSRLSKHFSASIDGYWIELKNRLVLSGVFKRSSPDVASILAPYPDVDEVQFMTNAISTITRGVDIVLNSNWNFGRSVVRISFAGNMTSTRLFGDVQTTKKLSSSTSNASILFNREEKGKIESGQPQNKFILFATYSLGNIECTLRNTLFGRTATYATTESLDETFSSKLLTDLVIVYRLKPWLTLTAGVNNLFDVYPDGLKNYENTNDGRALYSSDAMPFGYNGGYYSAGITFNLSLGRN